MGHAILERSHFNETLPNGMAKSIMCSAGPGIQACNLNTTWFSLSSFTPILRTYYLDELFMITDTNPTWSSLNAKENARVFYEDDFEIENDWQFRVIENSMSSSYDADITFKDSNNSTVASILSKKRRLDETFAYWFTSIEPMSITEGSLVELSATIQTKDLIATEDGTGAGIAIRIDSGDDFFSEPTAYSSTQYVQFINGTNTNRFTIEIPYFPSDAYKIYIYLMIYSDTQGEASFDDIELKVYE